MASRSTIRRLAPAVLAVAVLTVSPPALSSEAGAAPTDLPECRPAGPSTRAPDAPPAVDDPRACRARPPRLLELGGPDRAPAPPRGPGAVERRAGRDHTEGGGPGGYHHLGVATSAQWAGVTGRMTVRDAAVRAGSWDFLATRFMAKRHVAGGEVFWLEAGWAETGWSGDGRQRVYTYDTNGRAWRFYDDYALRDGQQIWIGLHSDGATSLHSDGATWQAWLWWDDRWNLLSAQHLPTGRTAQIEQYVEVHVDRADPVPLSVPPVNLDNVQLRDPVRDRLRYWRAGHVATTPTRSTDDGYCLNWTTRYDTWSAGDCPQGPRQAGS